MWCRLYKVWLREQHFCMMDRINWFNELCLELILEIAWCVIILLANSSFFQHICRCVCAWGCSVCWVYEKISLDPTTMFLVWWSTISDSLHILHTGTWLGGDHSCKCWKSSCNCAAGQETFLISPIGDTCNTTTKNWSIIFNYLRFLVANLLKLG